MIFNSYDFIVFIVVVFVLYWFVFKNSAKYQNILLLISSLFFYCWADWRFLGILVFNILFNFYLAKKIDKVNKEKTKQLVLWFGIIVNIGILGYYKYFNFFYESIQSIIDPNASFTALSILIPLGISFYTFQTLAYIIDVYYEDIAPYNNLFVFSTYMTYFPKLLSGPIEKAQYLIPQLITKRPFDYYIIVDGLRQILWGLFAKIVIAENCAIIVNPIFENYNIHSGSTLFVVGFFYMIQLYADFSGYSNMAIGVSKLLGIKLSRNFATPFFSLNIGDFWRKWHMSLTSWMLNYIFTPLSFILRSYQKLGLIISVVFTFLIVGLWHGANWTYVVFGLIHGLYFIPVIYSGSMNISSAIVDENKWLPSIFSIFKMAILFMQVMLVAIFFRAESISMAINYLKGIFSASLLQIPYAVLNGRNILIVLLIVVFLGLEWINRGKAHDLEISNYPKIIRWVLYIFIFLLLLFAGQSTDAFIYFQF
ncbi:MAG: MBOAT family protein [Flavobacteriaceae bacterium]|nr:MBOAT family protein [Flavobacteriaceae bacterium]